MEGGYGAASVKYRAHRITDISAFFYIATNAHPLISLPPPIFRFCFVPLHTTEDKTTEAALRYWFQVCDVDGDGVLSSQDLRYFYR